MVAFPGVASALVTCEAWSHTSRGEGGGLPRTCARGFSGTLGWTWPGARLGAGGLYRAGPLSTRDWLLWVGRSLGVRLVSGGLTAFPVSSFTVTGGV